MLSSATDMSASDYNVDVLLIVFGDSHDNRLAKGYRGSHEADE